jgi:ubiquinone/menaquinone biosynthesis C-methylase UbiE
MSYDTRQEWNRTIHKQLAQDAYPAQGLIRILRGSFPELTPFSKSGKALDLGCGDGRNAIFLANEGYEVTGLEITEEIIQSLQKKFPTLSFATGTGSDTKCESDQFDLIVAWHAIYYMGIDSKYVEDHFRELFRVVNKNINSRLVMSIPMADTFIYNNSELLYSANGVNYVRVTEDPHDTRVGETLAQFPTLEPLLNCLAECGWTDFEIGEERGNWFGRTYNWWDVVCKPKI